MRETESNPMAAAAFAFVAVWSFGLGIAAGLLVRSLF